jgi:hypothetical protein
MVRIASFPLLSRKVCDQVHRDRLEGESVGICRDSIGKWFGRVCADFILLACRTSFNVFLLPIVVDWATRRSSQSVQLFYLSPGGQLLVRHGIVSR